MAQGMHRANLAKFKTLDRDPKDLQPAQGLRVARVHFTSAGVSFSSSSWFALRMSQWENSRACKEAGLWQFIYRDKSTHGLNLNAACHTKT